MFKEIISLYGYNESEQRDFKYIAKYMSLINPHSEQLLKVELHRKKYIIAGIFLTYRACNHMGVSLSTRNANDFAEPDRERLSNFKRYTGHEILSTRHYLDIMGLDLKRLLFMRILFKNPGSMLYKFVISKRPINWGSR